MTQTGQGVQILPRSRNDPMKPIRRILASLSLVALIGCHCAPVYEPYNDVIDLASDTQGCMERHYSPTLDVTRWGRSNGPCCCRKKCCH